MPIAYPPTPEQQRAIDAAKTGENVVITACAGAGKTSTLRFIADALAPAKMLYIAYNKAIQTDAAASFPSNVQCRTAHSLAFRTVGVKFKARLNGNRVTARQAAEILDIDRSYSLGQDRELGTTTLASLVMQTVERFCHSADTKIGVKHTPEVPGAEEVSHDLAVMLAAKAQWAWDNDLTHTSGRLRFTHDMYLKIWALGNPTLPADVILYDEAQDADPCIAGVILAQRGKQLIAVGDESQAIYGWRGAVDAMRSWPAQHRVSLTKSFRFGPAVAAEANVFLNILNAPIRVEGFDKIASVVGPVDKPSAILCRTNAQVIAQVLSLAAGTRYAVVGGVAAIRAFAEGADSLMRGRRSWHPDLAAFKSWDAVMRYVDEDEGGSDLRVMVNMIRDFGIETLFDVCDRAVPEDRAEVVLSTAHKAKGREWDHVKIAPDFEPVTEEGKTSLARAEAMLMYVAVTRAKLTLDASPLEWAKELA